jgi:phosphoribosylformimino-5-aminoimidazole carboxamide ribotide isomerase
VTACSAGTVEPGSDELDMEILPAIDLRGGKCVRLRQGDYAQETVFGDDPLAMARRFASEGATRLHLVDLDGARAGRPVNLDALRSIVTAVEIPCEIGGGVRDEQAIRLLLEEVGADRVIIGTQALKNPGWFAAMARKHPGRLALGIDARDGLVATEGWLDVSSMPAIDLARAHAGLPVAALIYTNIANDGMLRGIDEATIRDLLALADLGWDVIASGGVTTLDDVRRLQAASRRQPRLAGAIVGRALYEGTLTVAQAVAAAQG